MNTAADAGTDQTPPHEFDAHGLLTAEAISRRLCINSATIIEDIYKHAQQQVKDEEARAARLDTKATTLVSSTNLALTVAFTFGASTLVQHPELFTGTSTLAVPALAVAVVSGMLSSVLGLLALRSSKNLEVLDERTLFDDALLTAAASEVSSTSAGDDLEAEEMAAATLFRRTMIEHLWSVSQGNFVTNQRRAHLIAQGQLVFLVFLLAVVALGSIIVSSTLYRAR